MIGRLFALALLVPATADAGEFPDSFFAEYCFDCHDDLTAEADVRLDDVIDRDWEDRETQLFFERVRQVIGTGEMPPAKKKTRPTKEEQASVVAYLHDELLEHTPIGGTELRRLNVREYELSVRRLFGIPFETPEGFPADQLSHGFDTLGEGLVLSPPLMEAYTESAVAIADLLFPPPPKPVSSTTFTAAPDEMVISYSSGAVVDGAMRIASRSKPMMRSCTWPEKFEAKASGIYRVTLDLSQFRGRSDDPMILDLRAKAISDSDGVVVDGLRQLASFEVSKEAPDVFTAKVEIYEGETVVLYFRNAPLSSEKSELEEFEKLIREKFAADPKLHAAWLTVELGQGLRGGTGWERVKNLIDSPDLDLGLADLESRRTASVIATMLKNPVNYTETFSYEHFERGPALEIHALEIKGPFRRVEDDRDRDRRKWQARFLDGKPLPETFGEVRAVLRPFLTRAFRAPVSKDEAERYTALAMRHVKSGRTMSEGLHLVVRSALVSPRFLFREGSGVDLNDWELASRLSFFLTSAPADPQLVRVVESGKLREPGVIRAEATRLLRSSASRSFKETFVNQWLHLTEVRDIMPDPRLLKFSDSDHSSLLNESKLFFAEILEQNLPLETFIDPGFTYMNEDLGRKIYGQKDIKGGKMRKVALADDSPYGGILGQAAVMMATANGVDTQPVLRGMWVLENVLGNPPPPPPKNVPAITPDTRGMKTVRDLLDAHRSDANCARCHVKMDPLGYVLENFDPVGRWRETYPIYKRDGKRGDGPAIDATGTLPDGAGLTHIRDLKNYIVENIDEFAQCLSEKLLTYGTGRVLTYSDREAIRPIVANVVAEDLGFEDLLLDLVASEVFLTK